jgi:tetratricopeptide (TPR) repeat protein
MFTEHPLVGSGWGTFQLRFPELQAQFFAAHPEFVRHWTFARQLHNDPLQILLEAGAIGLTALLWLVWAYAREVRETRRGDSAATRHWLGASAGGVTAILVNSIFNFEFAVPPTLILLFTLLAMPQLLKPCDDDAAARPIRPGRSGWRRLVRALASVLVFAAAALLALGIARRAVADHRLARGLAEERRGDLVQAELEFRAGLEQAPDEGPLHYGLSRALYVQGEYPEALREALLAQPTVADSHLEVLKARIQEQMGYSSPAFETYRHALWLNPRLQSVRADIERLAK